MNSPIIRFISASRIQGAIMPTITISTLFSKELDFERDFSRNLVGAARNFENARNNLIVQLLAEINLIGEEMLAGTETPNFDMGEELLQKA